MKTASRRWVLAALTRPTAYHRILQWDLRRTKAAKTAIRRLFRREASARGSRADGLDDEAENCHGPEHGQSEIRYGPGLMGRDAASWSRTRLNAPWRPIRLGGDTRARNEWMPFTVEMPYLRIPKWAKGVGCTETGAVFRAPWRLTTDQRVFRMDRAKRQGSLLIDASGSMDLSAEAVERIVRGVPAAVIGVYSADYDNDIGQLQVVAKFGRLVVDPRWYEPVGAANGIDGPALRWLGMQPQPRLWISDGCVTGIRDGDATNLRREARDLCERFRIRRVATMGRARKFL